MRFKMFIEKFQGRGRFHKKPDLENSRRELQTLPQLRIRPAEAERGSDPFPGIDGSIRKKSNPVDPICPTIRLRPSAKHSREQCPKQDLKMEIK